MMQLADLASSPTPNAVLDELADRLGVGGPGGRRWPDVDVVVVGAGPAGAAAALDLGPGRARRVVLLERGPFPGSKNMYGGVVYGRILDALIPRWWEEAPVQRWVTRRSTMVLTEHPGAHRRLPHARAGAQPPYNGATAYRPDFDAWLAGKAEAAGAELVCSTTATGLLRDGNGGSSACAPTGPTATSRRSVVIACDGVNSFLAKEAGLYHHADAEQLHAGREGGAGPAAGGDRRALRLRGRRGRRHRDRSAAPGASPAAASSTPTSTRWPSAWCCSSPALAAPGSRPEELIADLKAHPADRARWWRAASSRSTRPT